MENQNAPLCTNGMQCTAGCPCAGKDGICHCPMIDDQKCACNGHCVVPKRRCDKTLKMSVVKAEKRTNRGA